MAPLDLDSSSNELYVFYNLSFFDMRTACKSLSYIDQVNDEYLRCVLFRDAVINYAKPFSRNKGVETNNLTMSKEIIPDDLMSAHEEIIMLRNKLFAHADLNKQNPTLNISKRDGEKRFQVHVDNYSDVYPEHLINPLKCLAEAVHQHLITEFSIFNEKHH